MSKVKCSIYGNEMKWYEKKTYDSKYRTRHGDISHWNCNDAVREYLSSIEDISLTKNVKGKQ